MRNEFSGDKVKISALMTGDFRPVQAATVCQEREMSG